jgi:hypothetical protein
VVNRTNGLSCRFVALPTQLGAPNAQVRSSVSRRSTRSELALPAGVSTIGAVARYGPPNDFNNLPTTKADFGGGADPPADEPPPIPPDQSETSEALEEKTEPAAWYRKPVVLIVWALIVLVLMGLIVYGLGELIEGGEGTAPAPSTTTTAPSSSTSAPTTTPPASSTTPTTAPTSTAIEPPPIQQQPTQEPKQEPTQKHHPHLPPLPPVITIPGGPTVTLPFGH